MNIFVVDEDPKVCASYLDDKRVVKMVLETAQLMSTTLHTKGYNDKDSILYKATHHHHPCTLWVGETFENYCWTVELFKALSTEYTLRYNKVHRCYSRFKELLQKDVSSLFTNLAPRTPFAKCVLDEFRELSTFEAYKETLKHKWKNDKRPPTWKGKTKQ